MFGFTVKKAFFDLWDNLIPLVLINLLLIFLLLLPLLHHHRLYAGVHQ
ncbi:MAG: hypothetical protein ACOCWS_02950 [Alkalispirochaetaceae bacterium]